LEEIAIVLSSLAGACTAVALDKIPKTKRVKQTITVNSVIDNQLQSLKMEKEILSKTITRLHQQESDFSGVQKDKLLIRYQHQLGRVIAKIDKLETASKYPDFGPVGDSLISLMDNRLAQLDQRLHEISSKITSTNTPTKQIEKPVELVQEKPQVKKIETAIEPEKEIVNTQKENSEIQKERSEVQKEKPPVLLPPIEMPSYEKHRTVELSTLTEITNKIPEFPADLIRHQKIEPPKAFHDEIKPKEVIQEIILVEPTSIQPAKQEPLVDMPKQELVQPIEKKVQIPTPIKIPEDEKIEDDDKDLDKIKSEIMKALSKLEQVEVE
jgi:hypothetical protein